MSSALTRTDVATQSKFPRKHAAVQILGCRACVALKSKAHSSVMLKLAGNKLPCIIAIPLIPQGLGAARLRY